MKILTWITAIALVLLALFAIPNWAALSTPVTLDLLGYSTQGPLGLILLATTLLFVALFTIYALSLRTTALVETRRHMKALETQRELADKAEASRFTALGAQLEQEFASVRASLSQSHAEALQRADALEAAIRGALAETANELSANIGQIDDKLDRMAATR